MVAAARAGGEAAGLSWLQVEPSQAQVSERSVPWYPAEPPKRIRLSVSGSKASEGYQRGLGMVAEACSVQSVPSQVQVSEACVPSPLEVSSTTVLVASS